MRRRWRGGRSSGGVGPVSQSTSLHDLSKGNRAIVTEAIRG